MDDWCCSLATLDGHSHTSVCPNGIRIRFVTQLEHLKTVGDTLIESYIDLLIEEYNEQLSPE